MDMDVVVAGMHSSSCIVSLWVVIARRRRTTMA